jgi:hypothetical protein
MGRARTRRWAPRLLAAVAAALALAGAPLCAAAARPEGTAGLSGPPPPPACVGLEGERTDWWVILKHPGAPPRARRI